MSRAPGTLKQAYRDLITGCGGFEAAALKVRVSVSQLNRYTDPTIDREDVHMPSDIVAALEAHCGRPIVSGWLAQAVGFRLVAVEPSEPSGLHDLVTASIDATSTLTKTSLASLAAGAVTPTQAGKIRHEAKLAIDALSAIHDAAATIQRNGEGG